ncbi:Hypothetical protein LUCI_2043 [Lucifera butyrica]|uniref:Uncharacterized protein n=1 Tax=Lucifera butyrica TaxID=1351585 RepID=A0A498R2F3_9FIRM|nr:hypothetical protein [Lucifera butyrica]VBB06806.1 Hypothetical protein LUCI_2043 [Lucifera butyrica]
MNIKNLFLVITLKDDPFKVPVEGYRQNKSGNNELLVTLFDQKLWVDAHAVKLFKGRGSTFCWKDHQEGIHIELNETCEVCPDCGWWKCPHCGACRCNKPLRL